MSPTEFTTKLCEEGYDPNKVLTCIGKVLTDLKEYFFGIDDDLEILIRSELNT
jgi:hypothetical protein